MASGYPVDLACACGAVWFGTARRKAYYENVLAFWRLRHKRDGSDEYATGHGWVTTHEAVRVRSALPPERMAALERDEEQARRLMRHGGDADAR